MREEIRWIAEDGTIFEDEDECREYEWKESTASATFVLLSDSFKVLPVDEIGSYADCWYIYLPTEKSVRQIVQCWDTDLISVHLPTPFLTFGMLTLVYGHMILTMMVGITLATALRVCRTSQTPVWMQSMGLN